MKNLFLLLSLLFCRNISAQVSDAKITFGEFSKEEIEMQVYALDTGAVAVILYDYGEVSDTWTEALYRTHFRRKILKEEGLKWRNVLIYKSTKAIKEFKAVTYNLVGDKLIPTELKWEDVQRAVDVNADEFEFEMPNVHVGSLIEVYYESENVYEAFDKGQFKKYPLYTLHDWFFQNEIPTIWSEFQTNIITTLRYNRIINGHLFPYINEKHTQFCGGWECNFERTVMKDVPAFKGEPFMLPLRNYFARISYAFTGYDNAWSGSVNLISEWEDVAKRYRDKEMFSNNVKGANFLKKISSKAVENVRSHDEKIKVLYDYVTHQIQWNDTFNISPVDIRKANLKHRGNSASINLTFLAMLRYAGINADPVLIKTKDRGIIRQTIPSYGEFDHVLIQTDFEDKKILIDCINSDLAFGFLNEQSLTGFGYLIGDEESQWIEVKNQKRTKIVFDGMFQFDENSMFGNVNLNLGGYLASQLRKETKRGLIIERTTYGINDSSSFKNEWHFENISEVDENLIATNDVSRTSDLLKNFPDSLSFIPYYFGLFFENPFSSNQRKYDIDFGFPVEILVNTTYKIPKEYSVQKLPEQSLMLLPNNSGKFLFNALATSQNEIKIVSQFVLNKAIYEADLYFELKTFLNNMLSKYKESIWLHRN